MDLGLKGKRAIVCASSLGLGRACAAALAAEGVSLVLCARGAGPLEATAAELRAAYGVEVVTVPADITTAAGRASVLAAGPAPDILVNNAGGPPPGDFRQWDETHWQAAVNANMITPILMIKAVIDGMIGRRFGRIVNITSSAVKMPIATLGLSNGARTGLTGFVAGLARQVSRHNVTINNLLPGPFATDRLKNNVAWAANQSGRPFEEIWQERQAQNPAGRFGEPEELGQACAYLCGAQAGFITGQNIVLDGGAYPGTM